MAFRKQAIKNESLVSVDMLAGFEILRTFMLGKHTIGFLFDSKMLNTNKRHKKEAQDSADHSSQFCKYNSIYIYLYRNVQFS